MKYTIFHKQLEISKEQRAVLLIPNSYFLVSAIDRREIA